MRFLIALVLITTACKKESKTEGGAAGGNPCEAAVERGVDQTISKRRGSNAAPMSPAEADVPKKLKVALAKSCVDDKWSTEVIDCFKTADDIATCKEKLTPEQRGAYTRAAIGVMQGAAGSGGMPPHGGGMGGSMGGSAPPPSGSGDAPPPPSGSGDAPPAGSAAGSGSN